MNRAEVKIVTAHLIAKQIAAIEGITHSEALEILEIAKANFESAKNSAPAAVPEYPVEIHGWKANLPGQGEPGK